MIGDQVPEQVRVRQRMLDGVKDAAIRARRLQLNDPREREHRCPITPTMPGDQWHVVVRVMRRHRLDVSELRVEPASLLHGSPARDGPSQPRPPGFAGQGRRARRGSW